GAAHARRAAVSRLSAVRARRPDPRRRRHAARARAGTDRTVAVLRSRRRFGVTFRHGDRRAGRPAPALSGVYGPLRPFAGLSRAPLRAGSTAREPRRY